MMLKSKLASATSHHLYFVAALLSKTHTTAVLLTSTLHVWFIDVNGQQAILCNGRQCSI